MMRGTWKGAAILVAAALAPAALSAAARAAGDDKKAPTTLTSFFALPKDQAGLTLTVAGQKDPITVPVNPDTGFGGVCIHCMLNQPFKVSETKKICQPCGCGQTNAACVAWKDMKASSWEELLHALPPGVALRAAFNTVDKPESGVKGFWIDRKAVILPVTGLEGKTPAELTELAKAAGGGKAELIDGGGKLVLTLKADYDAAPAAKLMKALVKLGGKVVKPEPPAEAK